MYYGCNGIGRGRVEVDGICMDLKGGGCIGLLILGGGVLQ